MTVPILPPPAVRRLGVPALRPVALHAWEARRLSLDALTGQAGAFTRASTATMTDGHGATVTVGHSMPRWEPRAWGDGVAVGLRMTTDDASWPAEWTTGTRTVLIEGINLGTAQTSGEGLLYVGVDAATGNRLVVRGTGTTFAVDLVIGANTSTATLASAVPNGAAFQLAVTITDTGTTQAVEIRGTVNRAVVAPASGSAIARGEWGDNTKLRINRVGSAGSQGDAWFKRVSVYPEALTLDAAVARL